MYMLDSSEQTALEGIRILAACPASRSRRPGDQSPAARAVRA